MPQQKLGVPNDYFATEIANANVQASVTSITIAAGIATVTQTAHGYAVGQLVTFSGVTGAGVTGLNGAHWQVATVPSANTYTFATTLTGTVGGTVVAQPVYVFGSGDWTVLLGANGVVEYNPDNTADALSGVGVTGATWRQLIAASGSGVFHTDGNAYRFRASGTTATSYLSQVK